MVRFATSWLLGFALIVSGHSFRTISVERLLAMQRALPELLYTCPMHAEVLEAGSGSCPICKMKLEPVRIETDVWYACPLHAATLARSPGVCPLDRRQKLPVVVTVHWICDQSPDQKLMEPGTCANGSARREIHQIRAHGDHNPRHGGQFYMAADNWHHLEGTYPRPGLFRVYFYDNFTKPIDVKNFIARLVDEGSADVTLKPGSGNTMEAPLKADRTPIKLRLKVRFSKDTAESQFDFTFSEPSREPVAAPSAVQTGSARATAPAASSRAPAASTTGSVAAPANVSAAPAAATVPPAVPTPAPASAAPTAPTLTNCEANVTRTDVLLLSDALPKEPTALLNLLAMCRTEVQKLIDGGQFGFVYQPTMLGKDIALALDGVLKTLPERQQRSASDGIRRVVLSAWELDLYGDLGDQTKLTEAYQRFSTAIADIRTAYAAPR